MRPADIFHQKLSASNMIFDAAVLLIFLSVLSKKRFCKKMTPIPLLPLFKDFCGFMTKNSGFNQIKIKDFLLKEGVRKNGIFSLLLS